MEIELTDAIGDPVTFERPPVGEVALSVQMGQPVTDDSLTLGEFWPRVRDKYPSLETQPPLPPMTEDFSPGAVPQIAFQLIRPSSRLWLLTADSTELIQVQPDRFGYNWRKEPADAPYPRYRYLREQFLSAFSTFVAAISEKGRTISPTWCEVTYLNPIAGSDATAGLPGPEHDSQTPVARASGISSLAAGDHICRALSDRARGRPPWSPPRLRQPCVQTAGTDPGLHVDAHRSRHTAVTGR